MRALNKIQLIGHVGQDPEIRRLDSGKVVAKFSLATTEKYNDTEQTTWHNIIAWGKLAELTEKFVTKGQLLYVEGKQTNRSYEDKEGVKKYTSEVVAFNTIYLSKPEGAAAVSTVKEDDDGGDLPF